LTYYSEASGEHTFLLVIYAGTKTANDRESSLTSYSGNNRKPYASTSISSCGASTDDAVWQILNDKINASIKDLACNNGYPVFTSTNNYSLYHATSYSSGTYASNNKMYWKSNDNCIAQGTLSTDDGSDNTVNGWIHELGVVWGEESAKVTTPEVVGFIRVYKDQDQSQMGWAYRIFTGTRVCVSSGIFD
jgi:hypothetical protein